MCHNSISRGRQPVTVSDPKVNPMYVVYLRDEDGDLIEELHYEQFPAAKATVEAYRFRSDISISCYHVPADGPRRRIY